MEQKNNLNKIALLALGVVFGDIGTSPLYALRECFAHSHGLTLTQEHVFGVLSLMVWSLFLVISGKYLLYVMRADNKGEGGAFAQLALLQGHTQKEFKIIGFGTILALLGSSLIFGDGVITPAISVLSAVEGIVVVAPSLKDIVVPLTLVILFALFSVQSRGTKTLGQIFGPIILLWFTTLGFLGMRGILGHPEVLASLNPLFALKLAWESPKSVFYVLAGVFLAVTGGEALYADMGHFGRPAIKRAWFFVVLPGLVLNYMGQGALLLADSSAQTNPFYLLAPNWALVPLICIATAATVIASQALISGVFSLTSQAVQLGYLPRLVIKHTSSETSGQIYVPIANWLLLLGTTLTVIFFKSSSNLAAAYGIAVSLSMIIDTMLTFLVSRSVWGWKKRYAIVISLFFVAVDLVFISSNSLKVLEGGLLPLMIGAALFTVMTTWYRGRQIVAGKLKSGQIPVESFVAGLVDKPPHRVEGTALVMSRSISSVPPALAHNLELNKILHERVIILTIKTSDIPVVEQSERVQIEALGAGFYRVIAHFGFMQQPALPDIVAALNVKGLELDLAAATFFMGRETIIPTKIPGMALWRERLFATLSSNAQNPTEFYGVPRNRVIEIGLHIEI